MELKYYFIIYIILINIISFFVMYIDKKKAEQNKYRISEKTLFILALILGGIGIYSGMYKFKHKTKHLKFTIFIPIIIVLNFITIYFIFKYV